MIAMRMLRLLWNDHPIRRLGQGWNEPAEEHRGGGGPDDLTEERIGFGRGGGQKGTAEVQRSQKEGDKEGEIVAEADRCLKLLETEGSAVAFTRVLEEVRADMVAVQRRLGVTIVDLDTQGIEENIITMLKEMIAALKKAQQDLQNPPPNNSPSNPSKPNQKLINLLAELKLIRSLQSMVNSRTLMYGKKYQGEQTVDPLIDAELKQLSQRQAKLQDMINKIASGENQ
jgi:hypothetical protein